MPRKNNKIEQLISRVNHVQRFYEAAAQDLSGKALLILHSETPGKVLRLEWQADIRQMTTRDGVVMRISNARVDDDPAMWEKIMGWLNGGTSSHWVFPVVAQVLHWKNEAGEDCFSKGHVVSGIRAAHFMEKTEKIIKNYMKSCPSMFKRYLKTGALPR